MTLFKTIVIEGASKRVTEEAINKFKREHEKQIVKIMPMISKRVQRMGSGKWIVYSQTIEVVSPERNIHTW